MSLSVQGVRLDPVGQGCMGVGGRFSADCSRDSEQIASLRLGIELGMTFIDTAEVYGAGHSEEIVGKAVSGLRDKVFLASKVSPENLSPDKLAASCEKSLSRLGVDCLDLYQIHWPNPAIPLEDSLGAMLELRRQGKIRKIGVSNFSLDELGRASRALGPGGLFSLQMEYNLFERGPERELIPFCQEHGMLFIAYSPLDQGHVVWNASARASLERVAAEFGFTPAQAALKFLASKGPVLPIPKALSEVHVRENASALALEAGDSFYQSIDSECRVPLLHVPWRSIRPAKDAKGGHAVYTTLEEARVNPASHSPSPLELAEEIKANDAIKPIRVSPLPEGGDAGGYRYDLLEGRLRFWAWVLAFDGARDVPVLVRN